MGESADMMGLVDGIVNWLPGRGAPFTSWSRLDIVAIVRGCELCAAKYHIWELFLEL